MKILFFLFFSAIFANDLSWDEKLLYSASFGGVDVATATLKSKKIKNIENQDILRIEFKAKSKPSLKYIFPINDKIIVDVDLNTWQPLKVDKKIREGIPGTNPSNTNIPPATISAKGLLSCVLAWMVIESAVVTLVTIIAVASDNNKVGICATRPSPIVSNA